MGKNSLCKHEGEKIRRGRFLSEIYYCKECGSPIIETLFDFIAYLKNPSFLQNGKIIKKKMNVKEKIKFALEYSRLLYKFWERKRGRPRKGEDEDFEIFDYSDFSILPFKEGEDGHLIIDEKRLHHEPLYSPEKISSIGKGRVPGKTYTKYYLWSIESNKCLKKMMKILSNLQKVLNGKGMNRAVGWCMFKIENYPEKLPSFFLKYKPYEISLEEEDGEKKLILNGSPEKSLLPAYAFIFLISKINVMLGERELKYLCAASLKKTGCSIKEIQEVTEIKNMRELYEWERLLGCFMKVCWQDERILLLPKNPEAKTLKVVRMKDGSLKFYRFW